ncbi:hypothetical protein QFZ31_002236 [Neobacillus niacini]|nr:hypothetical protein [Neobacillus niacini]
MVPNMAVDVAVMDTVAFMAVVQLFVIQPYCTL